MSLFWGKFAEIEELFASLTDSVEKCLFAASDAIIEYIKNGENEKVKKLSQTAHSAESEADEHRRKIISKLLQGSLMPNTRADLMNLIEDIDDIADTAEDVLDSTFFISLDLSDLNEKKINEMLIKIKKQYQTLKKAVSLIFTDMHQALASAGQLEYIESEVDDIEEKIIRKISQREDIELAQKLAYRDTVTKIASLTDIIENAGDKIEIIVAVRRG